MSTIQNNVQLIGHLGDAPEEVKLDAGKKLVKFSLATNTRFKNKEGYRLKIPNGIELLPGINLRKFVQSTSKKAVMLLVKAA